jgi:hypothetical protein
LIHSEPIKAAGAPELSYGLAGKLYASKSGWLLLQAPNDIGRAAFKALNEPGISLPTSGDAETYNAHISVMRPEELQQIGGIDKITERGKDFHYTLGPVKTVVPGTWDGVSRVWFIEVQSPELKALRRTYGLSSLPNDTYEFHITFAVRKVGVLRSNPTSKAASLLDFVRHLDPCPLAWENVSPALKAALARPSPLVKSALSRTLRPPA